MKLKAYPRHRIQFSLFSLFDYFFSNDSINYADEFKNEFLKLTNAQYALLIPSCRFGSYHALKYFKDHTEELLMSGTTFSAMKSCAEAVSDNAFPLHLYDKDSIPSDDKKRLFLYSHLFHQNEIRDLKQEKLVLVEDCAHCPISDFTTKRFHLTGQCAVFSFGIGKSLSTLNGGVLITNDKNLYESLTQVTPQKRSFRWAQIPLAIKVSLMSLLTDTFLFSVLTFPLIKLIAKWNPLFLDHSLNENVTRDVLIEQISNTESFNDFQGFLGLKQLKKMAHQDKAKSIVIEMFIKTLHSSFHPYFIKPFTYLMIPFSQRDFVRRELLAMNIDTKVSDMDCYFPKDHAEYLYNSSLLEIPFSEKFTVKDVEYISGVLNQYSHLVLGSD